MPEGMMMPGQGAPPGGGAPAAPQPGQPPAGQATGSTPASMPAPNRGIEAAALAKLSNVAQMLRLLTNAFPVGSDVDRDLRDALNKIAKHVPPGAVSQGVQMTEAQRTLMQQKQQAPQIAAQRAAQMQPPAGGSPMPAAA